MPYSTDHDHPFDADGLLAGSVVDPAELLAQHADARARRRRQRVAAGAVAFVVFAVIAVLGAQLGFSDTGSAGQGAAPKVALQAESLGVLVIRPGGQPQRIAPAKPVLGVSEQAQGAAASWSIDGVASIERATTTASAVLASKRATASVSVERVSLLGGRIELQGASLAARAASADGHASSALSLGPDTKLLVAGNGREASVNQRIAVEGVGTVIINEQAVLAAAPEGDAQTGPRARIVGALAHIRLTAPLGGLPAGSEIIIGRVDTGVREGKVRAITHPAPGPLPIPASPISSGNAGIQTGTPAPGEATLPRRSTALRGSGVGAPLGSLQAYLFPVLGQSDYTDTWGAARASTGVPHQGTDIFATEGTPIVAVADGVLDRVGWNAIGGYRFWLYDQYGNSFYHAHLSAYAPLAVDGAHVKRGDVIGFVGHTGDAQFTPPHLHFEVHPGNGAATDPFPFLNAWKHGVAVAIGLLANGPERVAPLALLNFTDISANSGLQDSVLDQVPDTRARSIEQENAPRPTDQSLTGAIEGPGTSPVG
jgi:murein DD-endopeptidase MepM/ murein hydrolase activator NlpD